jgi:glycosyltransferase involved in cell wall biosynthesis
MPLAVPDTPHEPLKVLVNAVSAHRGGGATFLFEQLRALELTIDVHLTIITTEAASAAVRDICPHSEVVSWPARPLPIRILREQTTIPRRAASYDVVYVPGNFAIARGRAPQVLVLQSLWHFGEQARVVRARCDRPMRMRLAAESLAARASVRKAERVICVSETMRSCVVEDLGELEKISVVSPAPPRLLAEEGREQLTGEYVLSVGTDLPHKDWTGLIETFEHHRELPPLVLVGWCSEARRRELAWSDSRVRLLGPVIDRGDLANLYRNATCALAHSYLESYGLTAVEALSLKVPLAASDIPAHREFCGSAAHYYDPNDRDALATAVAEAIRTGPATAKAPALALTWAENAAVTTATMRSAIDDQR